jgi:hypothetical protein
MSQEDSSGEDFDLKNLHNPFNLLIYGDITSEEYN